MESKIDGPSNLPVLESSSFRASKLKKGGKVLLFLYAKWCPFCRAACKETEIIRGNAQYESYAVDLSDESNPLWEDLGVEIVPTLIGYADGEEILRKEAERFVGLKRSDFQAADQFMKEMN